MTEPLRQLPRFFSYDRLHGNEAQCRIAWYESCLLSLDHFSFETCVERRSLDLKGMKLILLRPKWQPALYRDLGHVEQWANHVVLVRLTPTQENYHP